VAGTVPRSHVVGTFVRVQWCRPAPSTSVAPWARGRGQVTTVRHGYDASVNESLGEPDGKPSPPQPARAGDPGLETTLTAFSDQAYRGFWPSRPYEDACDRIALRSFLPRSGGRLIEVGAGFGRLVDEYAGYREVVLLDASEALLQAAREQFGGDPRITIIAGDAFRLPFPDASFDAAVCIRVIHHFEDPRPAIRELGRVVRPGGVLVLESANKRNLKAVLAYWLRRQAWSPFARGSRRYTGVRVIPSALARAGRPRRPRREDAGEPGVPWSASVSYIHSPRDLQTWLRAAGFETRGRRSVGLLRLPAITSRAPLGLLVALERLQQVGLAPITAGPSVVLEAVRLPDSRFAAPDGVHPRGE
jgi:SAM-dependent methyltransferase